MRDADLQNNCSTSVKFVDPDQISLRLLREIGDHVSNPLALLYSLFKNTTSQRTGELLIFHRYLRRVLEKRHQTTDQLVLHL